MTKKYLKNNVGTWIVNEHNEKIVVREEIQEIYNYVNSCVIFMKRLSDKINDYCEFYNYFNDGYARILEAQQSMEISKDILIFLKKRLHMARKGMF